MTNRIDRANSAPLPKRAAGTAPVEAPKAEATPASNAPKISGDTNELAGPQTFDPKNFSKFLQDQGDTNGCGTTSLAMLLSYWKNKPGEFTRPKIDESIRHLNLFTAPQNVASYAEDHGMRASTINNGKLEDVAKLLDQGVPSQILFDPNGDGSDQALHYVVATDYAKDDKGNITSVTVANPAGGQIQTIDAEEFKKRWDKLEFQGVDTGLSNVMIPMLPKENVQVKGKDGKVRNSSDIQLPESTGMGWKAWVADKLTDELNDDARFVNGVVDTAKDVAGAVGTGAKKVWGAITSL